LNIVSAIPSKPWICAIDEDKVVVQSYCNYFTVYDTNMQTIEPYGMVGDIDICNNIMLIKNKILVMYLLDVDFSSPGGLYIVDLELIDVFGQAVIVTSTGELQSIPFPLNEIDSFAKKFCNLRGWHYITNYIISITETKRYHVYFSSAAKLEPQTCGGEDFSIDNFSRSTLLDLDKFIENNKGLVNMCFVGQTRGDDGKWKFCDCSEEEIRMLLKKSEFQIK